MSIGVNITPKDIIEGLHLLSYRINKDKNIICLALIVTNRNISEWYKEITFFIFDEMAKQLLSGKMTREDARDILSLMHGSDRVDAAVSCADFLEDIERRYNSGELRNLVDRLDVKQIAKIRSLIGDSHDWDRGTFIGTARSEADIVTLDYMVRGYGRREEAKEEADTKYAKLVAGELLSWLKYLESLKEEIRESISSVLYSLGCQQQSIEILYQQVFGRPTV